MKNKIFAFLIVSALIIPTLLSCNANKETILLYQGHASLRITSKDGFVIYVDPYAGEGYDVPADIILVTHDHFDHNMINLPAKRDSCIIITEKEALVGSEYKSFSKKGIEIEAVKAFHNSEYCVGYLITVDGFTIYVAGDTSRTNQMETLAELEIDYAFFPCDGKYTMSAQKAAECAEIVGAKHNIPYHTSLSGFSRTIAESFDAPNRLILEPGEEITLEH